MSCRKSSDGKNKTAFQSHKTNAGLFWTTVHTRSSPKLFMIQINNQVKVYTFNLYIGEISVFLFFKPAAFIKLLNRVHLKKLKLLRHTLGMRLGMTFSVDRYI